MKEYVKPVVLESAEMTEGVFANTWSGETGEWTWEAWWEGHNSGSHSEMQIKGHYSGKRSGTVRVTVEMQFLGEADITGVDSVSMGSVDWTSKTLTWKAERPFNPGENIAATWHITFSKGAPGEEDLVHGAYHTPRDKSGNESPYAHIIAPEWMITKHTEEIL